MFGSVHKLPTSPSPILNSTGFSYVLQDKYSNLACHQLLQYLCLVGMVLLLGSNSPIAWKHFPRWNVMICSGNPRCNRVDLHR